MIRVLIVDDHAFVRAALTAVLGSAAGVVVVGQCSDGSAVPDMARQVLPDVVVMDVQMPGTSGIVATQELLATQPTIRVLMLSGSMDPQVLEDAALAGAVGFVRKGGDPHDLVEAVRTVAAGGTAWPDIRPGAEPVSPS